MVELGSDVKPGEPAPAAPPPPTVRTDAAHPSPAARLRLRPQPGHQAGNGPRQRNHLQGALGKAGAAAPSANTSRWSTTTRPARAFTPPWTWITGHAGAERPRALRGQPAVPSADGLRRGDDHHRPLRARPGTQGLLGGSLRTGRERSTGGRVRAAAADLPARAAHGQRLLQPEQGLAPVRLLPGHGRPDLRPIPRRHGLHLSVARRGGARDHARAARRIPRALHGGDQPRRAGVSRGVRRHRRPVPALHVSGSTRAPDREDPRRPRDENLLGQLATQFGHARGTHGALRDAIGKYDPEQKKWVKHVPDPAELDEPGRCTRAARFSWPRSSTPSCRSTETAPATCCGWRAAAPACSRKASCTRTWSTAWPRRRPRPPATC